MAARLALAWACRLNFSCTPYRFLLLFQARLSLRVRIARTKKLALDAVCWRGQPAFLLMTIALDAAAFTP